MNILLMGFEADTPDDVKREAASWTDPYAAGLTLPTTGRRGTQCLKLRSAQNLQYALPSTAMEYFIGLAYYVHDVADVGAGIPFLTLFDSTSAGHYVRAFVNAGRRLQMTCSTGSSIQWVSNTPVTAGAWYHFGLHFKLHATTGALSAHFGGSPTPDAAEVVGRTIASSGVTNFDTLELGSPGTNLATRYYAFGDVYVNDSDNSDGLGDNVLWGDYKVTGRKLLANGSNTGLTRSTGTDDAALLGDNSDATYLYGTAGKTTLTVNPLGFTANSIKTRAVKFIADKEDATYRTLDCTTRVGGVDYDGGTPLPLQAASKRRYVFLQPVNPATSARWAQAALEASEVGPKVA